MITKQLNVFWNESARLRDKIGGRVFLVAAKQDQATPYVTVRSITSSPIYDLLNEQPCKIETIQVDIFGETATEADDIAEAIRMRTSGYYGPAGSKYIEGCTMERDSEFREQKRDGKGFLFRRSVDYRITYHQPVPTHSGY